MNLIQYINQQACLEQIPLKDIAEEFGTPCYVYSRLALEKNWRAFHHAFLNDNGVSVKHLICYAVKANSNLTILNLLSQLGSGFDIVSAGELERVLAAGGDPQKIVFSGVGKQVKEIEYALQANIKCFNVESELELERIQEIGKKYNKQVPIALRINPNIDAHSHPYISTGLKENKFGIELQAVPALLDKIKNMPNIKLVGIACHIGSQLVEIDPFLDVLECLRELYLTLTSQGISIRHIDVGGGLGVRYKDENPPTREGYITAVKEIFAPYPIEIILEPGRSIVADTGVLLTRVEYLKNTTEKNFAIVDAGMNDLLRPALYQAWHDIIPLEMRDTEVKSYDIVGPICETGDFIGKDRRLRLQSGDFLAVLMAGAYGASMSSNYNSRPRALELMLDQGQVYPIRRREMSSELFALEQPLPHFAQEDVQKLY